MKALVKIGLITIFSVTIIFSISIVFAANLDFRMDAPQKLLLPNETIPMNISIINRDTFTAKNATLFVVIGQREYQYYIGDLRPTDSYLKSITLPQFPAGTYTIKGIVNYTEIFDERFSLETFNSFTVRFPEIQRFPRSVFVKEFNMPENLTAGETYQASVKINNEGDVAGDLFIEIATSNESTSLNKRLEAKQSDTITVNITFFNSGITLVEARVFALIDNQKYFLNFLSKKVFIREAKAAKIEYDRFELVDENDNKINQIDDVRVNIYVKNIGTDLASDVIGTLTSSSEKIIIQTPTIKYNLIVQEETIGKEYIIKTDNADKGSSSLSFDISYTDNRGKHIVKTNMPITIEEGRGFCTSNKECASDETCTNNVCQKLTCGYCEYVKDNACQKYECCSDSQCPSLYTCDTKLHICKPPQCTKDTECADNEVCTFEGKCQKAFTLVVVPLGISTQDESRYLKYATNEIQFFRDTSPLRESKTSQSKNLRVYYISPSLCRHDTRCGYQSSNYCYEEMTECAKRSGLLGIADKLVAIVDRDIGVCGFASMGGFHNINKLGCKGTPAHELGHNLDLGHINCIANDMWTCIPPNADDCKEADKLTDIMSYCFEDHYGPQAYRHMKNKYFTRILEGS